MKKILLLLLSLIILFGLFLTSCSSSESTPEATTRTITYYDGETITVPSKITKIASGWNAQNSIIAMLGYGDKIVATTDIIKASPIFAKFVPSISNAVMCFTTSGEVNTESIVQADPDVAFIMRSGTTGAKFKILETMGIPVAMLKDSSLQNLIDRTLITGQILGDDAYKKAQDYVKYYNNNVKRVEERLAKVPESEKVRVYLSSGRVLTTSNRPSLNQDWMDKAGVINVAEEWDLPAMAQGNDNANLEEIIASNPDVIICMNAADAQTIKSDPGWAVIKAVKDGKVYVNPKGMFYWCRETTEEALESLWVAKTVYPEYFTDIDMAKETKNFYKTFYGYDLTEEDIELFLNPK
jgi:iron complex transport system substrate-binding protein